MVFFASGKLRNTEQKLLMTVNPRISSSVSLFCYFKLLILPFLMSYKAVYSHVLYLMLCFGLLLHVNSSVNLAVA